MNINGHNNTTLHNENISLGLSCAVYSEWDKYVVHKVEYYVEGVVLCCFAIPGLFANIVTIVVLLKQKSVKSIFSSLLICLFLFDSLILSCGVIWSFQTYFGISSNIQMMLFPIFVYPLKNISMTASIFMTVAIAHERYTAIREPVRYRRMMLDSNIRRRHFFKYLFLIILASVIFNIPKFFESEVKWIHNPVTVPTPHDAVDEKMLR